MTAHKTLFLWLGRQGRLWFRGGFFLSLLWLLVLLAHVTRWHTLQSMDWLDAKAYDYRLVQTMPLSSPQSPLASPVVIVDIDEQSLAQLGRWPWSRQRLAALFSLMQQAKPAVIAVDMVLAEPDETRLRVTQWLSKNGVALSDEQQRRLALSPVADRALVSYFSPAPVVLGYYFTQKNDQYGVLPQPLLPVRTRVHQPVFQGYTANLPLLSEAAPSGGHINATIDDDGVTRRVPLLIPFEGQWYESLALASVRQYLQADGVRLVSHDGQLEGVVLHTPSRSYTIPMDALQQTLVPFQGYSGHIPTISAASLWSDARVAQSLEGKIVLLGSSTPSLNDLRSVPMQSAYPGVDIHASLMVGILASSVPSTPTWLMGVEVLVLFGLFVLACLVLRVLRPWSATLVLACVAALLVYLNVWLWRRAQCAMPLSSSVALLVGVYVLHMTQGYIVSERRKRQLAALFGRYIPQSLAARMAAQPECYGQAHDALPSESRVLTVLFCDVRGFTRIAESTDAHTLTLMMNTLFTTLSTVVQDDFQGTIDKYIGDALMAFWGAPSHDPRHAEKAVDAAMALAATSDQLKDYFVQKGWPALDMSIGVNTGRMVVGDMGSRHRRAYTVLGDAVNVAARIETLTRHYGVSVLVGAYTCAAAPQMLFREIDTVRLLGRREAMTLFEPLGRAAQISRATMRHSQVHSHALALYRQQAWQEARALWLELAQENDALLYAVFIGRCERYAVQTMPTDWDGVHDFTVK